jgi:hypothetical protein
MEPLQGAAPKKAAAGRPLNYTSESRIPLTPVGTAPAASFPSHQSLSIKKKNGNSNTLRTAHFPAKQAPVFAKSFPWNIFFDFKKARFRRHTLGERHEAENTRWLGQWIVDVGLEQRGQCHVCGGDLYRRQRD